MRACPHQSLSTQHDLLNVSSAKGTLTTLLHPQACCRLFGVDTMHILCQLHV